MIKQIKAYEHTTDTADRYLELARLILIAIDRNQIVSYLNPYGCEMLGYSCEDIVGKNWFDTCVPQDTRSSVKHTFNSLINGEVAPAEYVENIIVTADKRERCILWHNSVRCDEQGIIVGTVSVGEDITERKQTEEALRHRLEFESLITTLSTHFINVSLHTIDASIDDALGKLGVFAGADRSYVFLFSDDNKHMSNTHEWCAEGIDSFKASLQDLLREDFPYLNAMFNSGELLYLPRVVDLPDGFPEKIEFQREHIQSVLNIPIKYGDTIIGFMGLDAVKSECYWDKNIIDLLKVAGTVFANALQRKAADEAFRASEEQHRTILTAERDKAQNYLNIAGSIIVALDRDGYVTMINTYGCALLGYEVGEVIGKQWVQTFIPDRYKEPVGLVFEETVDIQVPRERIPMESPVITSGGKERSILWNYTLLHDQTGMPSGFLCAGQDITDRVEAEQALRVSEASFRNLIETIPMGVHIYTLEAEDRLVFSGTNPAADKILQVDCTHFMGKTIEEAFPTLRDTEVPDRYRRAAAHGESWYTEQITYADEHINGAFEVYAFQTKSGQMAALFSDISKRKKIDESLHNTIAMLQSIFRVAPVGIGLVSERILIEVNDRICEMLGYTREELVGKHARILYPSQEESDLVGSEKYRQIQESGSGRIETVFQRKDGSVINILLSSTPLEPDDLSKGVTFTALDITGWKETGKNTKIQ